MLRPISFGRATHARLFVLFSVMFVLSAPLMAQSWSWASPVSGNWNDPSNWSPASVPPTGSIVNIMADGTYNVTVQAGDSVNINQLNVGFSSNTNVGQTLIIDGDSFQAGNTTVDTNGRIEVVNGGTLTQPVGPKRGKLRGVPLINISSGGVIELNSGSVVFDVSNGGDFIVYGNSNYTGDFYNSGTMRILGSAAGHGELHITSQDFSSSPTDLNNDGVIILDSSESTSNAWMEFLVGGLANGSVGQIQSNDSSSAGGSRTISGNLTNNTGQIQVNYDLILDGTGRTVDNQGNINLSNAQLIVNNGASGDFINNAGGRVEIPAGSTMVVQDGTLSVNNNNISGPAKRRMPVQGNLILDGADLVGTLTNNDLLMTLKDSTIGAGVTLTNNSELNIEQLVQLVAGATLTNSVGATLRIMGNATGEGVLHIPFTWANAGTLELSSLASNNSKLEVLGTFTNNGDVSSELGAGGARFIDANLDMPGSGTLTANHDLEIIGTSRTHTTGSTSTTTVNSGTLLYNMDGASSLVQEGAWVSNSGATFEVSGGAFTSNVTNPTGTGVFELNNTDFTAPSSLTNSVIMVFNNATINGGVTNDSDIYIKGNVIWNGTFTNNSSGGRIIVEGTSDGAGVLNLNAPVANDGAIELTSTALNNAEIRVASSGQFTNNGTGTITSDPGVGGDRVLDFSLQNLGSVTANVPTVLNPPDPVSHLNSGGISISAAGTFEVVQAAGSSFTNNGTIQALAGGQFIISGGDFNPGSGSVSNSKRAAKMPVTPAFVADNVNIIGNFTNNVDMHLTSATIGGGTTFTNDGNLLMQGTNTITGTLTNGSIGSLTLEGVTDFGAGTLNFAGSFLNNGILEFTSSTGTFDTNLNAPSGFTNMGTINANMGSGGMRNIQATLTNSGVMEVNGPVVINQSSVTHTNNGNINVNTGGSLDISLDSVASFVNNGTLTIYPDGTTNVAGLGMFNAASGTVAEGSIRGGGSPPTLFFNGVTVTGTLSSSLETTFINAIIDSGGTFTNTGNAAFLGNCMVNGNLNNNLSAWLGVISDNVEGSATLTLANPLNNGGTIELNSFDTASQSSLAINGTLTNNGSLNVVGSNTAPHMFTGALDNQSSVQINQNLNATTTDTNWSNRGTFNIADGFTVTFADANPSPPDAMFSNIGTLNLSGTSSALTLLTGTSFDNNDTGGDRGILNGAGTLTVADISSHSGGDINPHGTGEGLLNISGDFTLDADNDLIMDFATDTLFDQLAVAGNVQLGGDLIINLNGVVPREGDRFTVVTGTSLTGTFASVAGDNVGNGLVLVPDYTSTTAELVVEPGGVSWTGAGGDDQWATAANWDTNQVPDPCSAVYIDMDGTYSVQMSGAVDIWSLTLGGSTGIQTLETNGFDILVQDASTINANGLLMLDGSRFDSSLTTCLEHSRGTLPGVAALANNGTIEVFDASEILVSFSNGPGATLKIQGDTTGATLASGLGFVNDGNLILTSLSAQDAGLDLNSGTLVNNGDIVIEAGSGGGRAINGPFDNLNNLQVDSGLAIDPSNILVLPSLQDIQNVTEATLAHYSFDEPALADRDLSSFETHLELIDAEMTTGAFHGALALDGIDDDMDLRSLRSALETRTEWTLSWLSRSHKGSVPLRLLDPFFTEPAMDSSAWKHYAAMWDGAVLSLYEDGVLKDTHNFDGHENATALLMRHIYLGKDPEADVYRAGLIDELHADARLWSESDLERAQEILAIANDWDRSSRINDPEGIRQVYVNACPTALIETHEDGGMLLYSRLLGGEVPERVLYMNNDGSYGEMEDFTLTPDAEKPHHWNLTGLKSAKRGVPTFYNGGTLTMNDDITMINGGLFHNQTGGVWRGNGTIDTTSGGSVTNDGTIQPGIGGPGTLSVAGNLQLSASGMLELGIEGLSPGTQFDQLIVNSGGVLNMGGTVNVTFENSFSPVGGEVFSLINYPSLVGGFATTNLPTNPPDTNLVTSSEPTEYVLEVEAIFDFRLGNATYTIPEDGSGRALFNIDVFRDGNTNVSGSVDIATSNGTATDGDDYAAVAETVSFPVGVGDVAVEFEIFDDRLIEGNEDFNVTLSNPVGGSIITPGSAVVTIIDVEEGTLEFVSATYSGLESDPGITVEIARVNGSSGSVSIDVATSNVSAEAGLDYTAISQTETWTDGDTANRSITIPLLDDTLVEGSETFEITLSNPTGNADLGTSQATITIDDYEEGFVQIMAGPFQGVEGDPITVMVERVNGTDGALSMPFYTDNNTAIDPDDYVGQFGSIDFADGVGGQQSITFTTVDDNFHEGTESFVFNLGDGKSTPLDSTLVTIEDNDDPPTLQFAVIGASVQEEDLSVTLEVVRLGATGGTASVIVGLDNGTAEAGSDYEATSTTLTFADGVTSQSFTINLIDDSETEPAETFFVSLVSPDGAALGTPNSITVTIAESDLPAGLLRFSDVAYRVGEGDGNATVTVERVDGQAGEVSVTVTTGLDETRGTDNFATPGDDYVPATTTLTWADGDTAPKTAQITIIDDNVEENAEVFDVFLADPIGGVGLGVPATAIVTIQDNEVVEPAGTIRFSRATASAAEIDGSVSLGIERIGGNNGQVTVVVSLSGNTATAGADFVADTQTVVFESGDTSTKTISVPLIVDDLVEGEESFLASLTATGDADPEVGTPSNAVVVITDSNNQTVRWASQSSTRMEVSSSRTITAILSFAQDSEIRIPLLISGSATRDEDYQLSTDTFVFGPGTNMASIEVTILEDDMVEGNEEAIFSFPATATIQGGRSHVMTIQDNDTAQVSWSSTNRRQIREDGLFSKTGPIVTLEALLNAPLSNGVDIPVTFSGTATNGSDYTVEGVLEFESGDTSAFVSLQIIDDDLLESNETIIATLGSTDGVEPGANTTHQVLVVDDERRNLSVSWDGATTEVTEGDEGSTSVTVTARLSSVPQNETVTVDVEVNGNATQGIDFDGDTAPSLTFTPGNDEASLQFLVFGDFREEFDESIILLLNPPSGVGAAPPSRHVIRILNDDVNQAPQTSINVLQPTETDVEAGLLTVKVGTPITLEGVATDDLGSTDFTFFWEDCLSSGGCTQDQGATLPLVYPEPGLFIITCYAEGPGGEDKTPAVLRIRVRENVPPTVDITSPVERPFDSPVGEPVTFTATATDNFKRTVSDVTWNIQGTEITGSGNSFTHTFDTVGTFAVQVTATDEDGASSRDHIQVRIYEDVPPLNVVVEAPSTANIGEEVSFQGMVIGPSGKREEDLTWLWTWGSGGGGTGTGQAPVHTFDVPGRYRVLCQALDNNDATRVAESSHIIYIVDPSGPPEVSINLPNNLRLEPPGSSKFAAGSEVYLGGLVTDDRGYKDLSFNWDISLDGERFNHETPGSFPFSEPGIYTVSLTALTPEGFQSNVDTRTIIVKAASDEEFEPNDSLEEASPVDPGSYSNLSLDEDTGVDVYKVTLESERRFILQLDVDGEVKLEIFDASGTMIGEKREISGQENVILGVQPAGDYFLRFYQNAQTKRRTLSYSFNLGVFNPALFLPDIRQDANYESEIGIVNPGGELVEMEVIGFDREGNIIDEVPLEIEAKGRTHQSVSELFQERADEVTWIQVDTTGEVVGYAHVESTDDQELYGITASRQLSDKLFVPHIAEITEQWYTRASVINGSADGVTATILTPATDPDESPNLNLTGSGFKQDAFQFIDRFNGSLPDASDTGLWASFEDQASEPTLAGVEIFGANSLTTRITAGLELTDDRKDNPNFTFVKNNLYFTHIAANEAFYTGIALVNLGQKDQGLLIHAYDAEGNALVDGGALKVLGPNEKLLTTAKNLLEGLGLDKSDVAWMMAEGDADIVGFVLFGSGADTLAGLEASKGLRSEICYPFVDSDPTVAHGISLVNVNDDPVTVDFNLYSDSGTLLGTTTLDLAPKQKYVNQLSRMFGELADGIPGWLEANSTAPLAGFELFINNINQMGAVIAQ